MVKRLVSDATFYEACRKMYTGENNHIIAVAEIASAALAAIQSFTAAGNPSRPLVVDPKIRYVGDICIWDGQGWQPWYCLPEYFIRDLSAFLAWREGEKSRAPKSPATGENVHAKRQSLLDDPVQDALADQPDNTDWFDFKARVRKESGDVIVQQAMLHHSADKEEIVAALLDELAPKYATHTVFTSDIRAIVERTVAAIQSITTDSTSSGEHEL